MLTQLLHCSGRNVVLLRHAVLPRVVLAGCASHRLTTLSQATLQLRVPSYMVWGANTDVGKTLVSAGLAAAARRDKVGDILVFDTRALSASQLGLLTGVCYLPQARADWLSRGFRCKACGMCHVCLKFYAYLPNLLA